MNNDTQKPNTWTLLCLPKTGELHIISKLDDAWCSFLLSSEPWKSWGQKPCECWTCDRLAFQIDPFVGLLFAFPSPCITYRQQIFYFHCCYSDSIQLGRKAKNFIIAAQLMTKRFSPCACDANENICLNKWGTFSIVLWYFLYQSPNPTQKEDFREYRFIFQSRSGRGWTISNQSQGIWSWDILYWIFHILQCYAAVITFQCYIFCIAM